MNRWKHVDNAAGSLLVCFLFVLSMIAPGAALTDASPCDSGSDLSEAECAIVAATDRWMFAGGSESELHLLRNESYLGSTFTDGHGRVVVYRSTSRGRSVDPWRLMDQYVRATFSRWARHEVVVRPANSLDHELVVLHVGDHLYFPLVYENLLLDQFGLTWTAAQERVRIAKRSGETGCVIESDVNEGEIQRTLVLMGSAPPVREPTLYQQRCYLTGVFRHFGFRINTEEIEPLVDYEFDQKLERTMLVPRVYKEPTIIPMMLWYLYVEGAGLEAPEKIGAAARITPGASRTQSLKALRDLIVARRVRSSRHDQIP